MGIKADFRQSDIFKQLVEAKTRIEAGIMKVMKYTGEEFVKNARENVTQSVYKRAVFDKDGKKRVREAWELTGNLRSSIGYFILKYGTEISSSIGNIPEDTETGKEAIRTMIRDLSKKQAGYFLVGVAGMNYASNVESYGYDVITNAKGVALVNLNQRWKDLEKHFEGNKIGDFSVI